MIYRMGQEVSGFRGDTVPEQFDGRIVAIFRKLGGQIRYVVENDIANLHIYKEEQLVPKYQDNVGIH